MIQKYEKIFLILCLTFILIFNTISASAAKYAPPYDEIDGCRLEDNMPQIFSFDTADKILVASCDFNTSYNSGSLNGGSMSNWSSSEGVIKIEKNQASNPRSFALGYSPAENFEEGDIYAFTCRIKTESLAGGAPRNILSLYGNQGYIDQTHGYDGKSEVTGTNEWYTMTQVMKIPEGVTSMSLEAYLAAGVTGTVYFDDFELYKLGLDPFETVLVSPNYKGLIYGDGYSDIVVDTVVSADGEFYDLNNMYLDVKLTDGYDIIYESVAESITEKMNFGFSSYGLEVGDYYLEVILRDKSSDAVISQKEHTIRKRDDSYRPLAYVDGNGHYIKHGDKRFISRIYNHSGVTGSDNYLSVAQEAKAMGIDTVSNYGMWWFLSNPIEDTLSYLRSNSMTTHICLSSYWFSDRSGNKGTSLIQNQSDILPLFTQIANDYKNEPALEGYYVFDEPDPLIVGEEIRWNNEILAEADIDHPTFGVADKSFDTYGTYAKMTDILGIDPYPVTGNTDENGVSTDDIAVVGRSVREIKKNFTNRPVYYVMQGFHYENRGDLRSPNYNELRNMAWQAICEGAEGLDWYAYPEMTADENKDIDTWKTEVSTLMSEIEDYEDIIMSDEPAPLYTVSGGGDWLNLTLRRYNGKTYIFAVNNTYTAKSATVNIAGIGDTDLSFEPLEVVIRELEQDAYLSPKAELISMGFGNGTEIFETSAGERVLYVSEDSGVINYTARISDNATLEIGGRQIPLTGKITVRNADSFTVTVRAENGYTLKRYDYRVEK